MKKRLRYLKVYNNQENYENRKLYDLGTLHLVLIENTYKCLFNNGEKNPNVFVYGETIRVFNKPEPQNGIIEMSQISQVNGEKLIIK